MASRGGRGWLFSFRLGRFALALLAGLMFALTVRGPSSVPATEDAGCSPVRVSENVCRGPGVGLRLPARDNASRTTRTHARESHSGFTGTLSVIHRGTQSRIWHSFRRLLRSVCVRRGYISTG